MRNFNPYIVLCTLILFFLFNACSTKKDAEVLFTVLESNKTGLDFANKLKPTPEFNMFKYMYFYNGAGAGAADFNNDGLIDLFFASNQGDNKIYRNKGALQFEDITAKVALPQDGGWSTGVSVIDINNDGLLDIYVCKVSNFEGLTGTNQLLICTGIDKEGIPHYKEKAADYGLNFSGFSTQAAFLDYDADGDLDMFLLNHSVHQNGTFAQRSVFLGTYHPLTGDRFYRNDGKSFTDVTKETGINSSAIGYGLGIAVADINLDGYPDIYIGNDFHENDYLYINQHNGTFKEELTAHIMHTSQFSMGVDIADINNDAQPEIISVDMLPSDPYILKRSLGEDEYNIFNMKLAYGYNPQYAKNALQLNRGNGMFSEVAMYANVFATDWSWAPLWLDFDNDGLKDLFVSNGIPRRLNDIDYVNYVSNDEVQRKINAAKIDESEMNAVEKFPQIKLKNKFFKNTGNVVFRDEEKGIENDKNTFSNGAVYADFDNDGDLDVVVNNIDEPALLYQNKSNDQKERPSLQIKLKGDKKNVAAIGTKIIVFANGGIRTYEKWATKGFQSSMELPMQIGLYNTIVDSALIVWPNNTYQRLQWPKGASSITIEFKEGLPLFSYSLIQFKNDSAAKAIDVTKAANLTYLHKENPFVEFDREPLIPHMVSREGPALAVADINGDGREDVFIGSSKGYKSVVYLQDIHGKFQPLAQPYLALDSTFEDVDANWVDVNGDGLPDLVVASGGNEYFGTDERLTPRVYINNKQTVLKKLEGAFSQIFMTASCIIPYDFTGDGHVDLFIGGRAVPWQYGQVPTSYLMENDGAGHFKDVTQKWSKELGLAGFVKGAIWQDMDGDGDSDLLLSLEWDGICAFINNGKSFSKKMLTDKKGWWTFTLPLDVDGDGDMDLIAGNMGENNRLKPTAKTPVTLYFTDFDGNGQKEQLLTYYLGGREIPFANKGELEKQVPVLKKKFLFAEDFAKASLEDLFPSDILNKADKLSANYFSNAVLINEGGFKFSVSALPWPAQLSSFNDAVVINANNDNLPDVFLAGNLYFNNIQMSRYDADFGTVLINKGGGNFTPQSLNGLTIKGEVRKIKKISLKGKESFILAKNNDSTMVIQMNKGF